MKSGLGLFARETLVYGLSTVLSRLLNFFLLPLYTYYLSPADYGIVATLYSYIALLNIVYGFGMDFAFMRHRDQSNPSAAFATAATAVCFWAFLISSALIAFREPVSRWVLAPEAGALTALSALILALDAAALVPFAELRMSHQAGRYVGIKTAHIAANLLLNVIFVAVLDWGIKGILLANLAASALNIVLLAPGVIGRQWAPRRELMGPLLRFGLPLLPAGLASMMVQVIDRPIIKFLSGEQAVGIYQANYRLSILMMMGVNMFDAAWRPFFLEKAGEPGGKALIARVLTYFSVAAGALFLLIWLFASPVVTSSIFFGRSLIHSSYWPGLSIIPIVSLGYLCNGLYVNFLAPVTISKRSECVAYATALGALVNLACNFLLIPSLGFQGAAWATLAAYAAMASSLYLMGLRIDPFPYEYGRLARVAASLAAACAVILSHEPTPNEKAWGLRLSLFMIFPAALATCGFLTPGERNALKRLKELRF